MSNIIETTLIEKIEKAGGLSTRIMRNGMQSVGVITRQKWAAANGLKPNSAEARRGYHDFRHAEGSKLAAVVAGVVSEGRLIPVKATPSVSGGLTVVYKPEVEVKAPRASVSRELAETKGALADAMSAMDEYQRKLDAMAAELAAIKAGSVRAA